MAFDVTAGALLAWRPTSMRIRAAVVVSAIIGGWGLVVVSDAAQQAVQPGQRFTGPRFDVRAPGSPGWGLTESGPEAMTFSRSLPASGDTYVAQVRAVPVPAPESIPGLPDLRDLRALAAFVVKQRSPPPRYQRLEERFELTNDRPYPCATSRVAIRDTEARTTRGTTSLLLHIRALICVLPHKPPLLTQIMFSKRGLGQPDDEFEKAAAAFIASVTVHER